MDIRKPWLGGLMIGVLILSLLPAMILAQPSAPRVDDANSPSVHSEAPEAFPWQPSQPVYSYNPSCSSHGGGDLAVDTTGNQTIAWTDQRNGGSAIYLAQRPDGGTWGANEQVAAIPGNAQALKIDVNGAGRIYAVWYGGISGGDLYFAWRAANGAWSASQRINTVAGAVENDRFRAAVDPIGNLSVVWTDRRNGNLDVYFARRQAGGVWGANERVNDDLGEEDQRYPDLAVNDGGNSYVVWDSGAAYFAFRSAAGVWNANENLSGGPVGNPEIAADPAGNAYVLFSFTDSSVNLPPIVVSRFRPAGGSWSWSGEVGSYCGDFPSIVMDAAGNAYAQIFQWECYDPGIPGSFRLYYRSPGGTSWTSNVVDALWHEPDGGPTCRQPLPGSYTIWRVLYLLSRRDRNVEPKRTGQ